MTRTVKELQNEQEAFVRLCVVLGSSGVCAFGLQPKL